MEVQPRSFALLRELSADRTGLSMPDGGTIEDVWAEMARRYPGLAPHRPFVRAARNGAYAGWEVSLADGDEVAFLPPVSGGGATHTSITSEPIDEAAMVRTLAQTGHGAVVSFVGRARDRSDDGRDVLELEYEAYVPMAEQVLEEIAVHAGERWDA